MSPPRLTGLVLLSLGLACGEAPPAGESEHSGDPTGDPSSTTGEGDVGDSGTTPELGPQLSPERRLLRASVLTRGIRPSLAEYAELAEDPSAYSALVDRFLTSPQFGAVVRRMHGEWLLTDTAKDYYPMNFPLLPPFESMGRWQLNDAISEGPARLAEYIVTHDRPYTELVTSDYTLTNEVAAGVWDLPYDHAQGGWQLSQFNDGRELAGLLSEPWFFVRHASTATNRQRARAAHLARALLCHDYMAREVRVPSNVDLSPGGKNSLTTNPVCISCHSTLDEFGAFLQDHKGVIVPEAQFRYPIASRENANPGDYPPAKFYGVAGEGLRALGHLIADDPRFARCTIRRFYGQLFGLDEAAVPDAVGDRYYPEFIESGHNVRALLRAMLLSPEFSATASGETLRLSPWHLAENLAELTGLTWTTELTYDDGGGALGNVPLLRDVTWGYRSLAGGADGAARFDPLRTADPTTLLVMEGLAFRAADALLRRDLDGGAKQLFHIDPAAGEAEIRGQLQDLHLRLFGERHTDDSPAIAASLDLLRELGANGDMRRAWLGLLTGMFMDPRILFI